MNRRVSAVDHNRGRFIEQRVGCRVFKTLEAFLAAAQIERLVAFSSGLCVRLGLFIDASVTVDGGGGRGV